MINESRHNSIISCKDILAELKSIKSYLEQVRNEAVPKDGIDHPVHAARQSGIHEGVDIALDRINYLVGYVETGINWVEGGES
ncbi:MAG: hypothetical protein HQK65_10030 [Desulfamplus sp.]|nr:hypothetical protein [Desulfamplus sp.]